ncbi:MAG TPA: phosphatase domain-containing protein [Candidatus Binatia bacterium]|nr:phosphatase domain-containing protein [Candidatus Binatia bacterium]
MSLMRRKHPARAPLPPLLCRWDLDKTYLRSEFDTLRQLWRTARETGADKIEVPGVADVIKGLRSAADRRERPVAIHFISASPPQIGKAIRDKLALDGVPYDGIVFKDQLQHIARGRFKHLREHVGFKLAELLRGRQGSAPGTRELLFGDDWESDPLTYSLYADIVAGRLPPDRLAPILTRIGVDPLAVPAVLALAEEVGGAEGVQRIFINLERRTPLATFQLFGPRLVPAFNYFQTAIVLAADGLLDSEDVARVARTLLDRSGFTPRRLDNSLADLLRRNLVSLDAARALSDPLRTDGLLPAATRRRGQWLERVRTRMRRLRRRAVPESPQTGPLDYDAILDRFRPAKHAAADAGAAS